MTLKLLDENLYSTHCVQFSKLKISSFSTKNYYYTCLCMMFVYFFIASITMYFQNGRKCFSLKRLICETSLNMTSVSCFTARSRWIRFWSKKHVRKNHLLVATFNYYRHNQLVALDELCLCKKLGINVSMYNYIIHTTF